MRQFGWLVLLCSWLSFSGASTSSASDEIISLGSLEAKAERRINAQARLPLAELTDPRFANAPSFEPAGSGRVPNYLRALAVMPQAAQPYGQALKTFLYGGTLAPELKLAVALRVAQVNNSPYVVAHFVRLLKASPQGSALLDGLRTTTLTDMPPAELAAVNYAHTLTRAVNGITDAHFAKVRAHFNDPQIVELTMTVCFFNYFTRFCEALNLPVEPWVLDGKAAPELPVQKKTELQQARLGLVTDEEMQAVVAADAARKTAATATGGLGLGLANSQRAMMQVPDLQAAWRNHGAAVRADSKIGRELQLHISFAVSMANGCRYCTVHQVVGLRRLGVNPAKLLALKKDDSTLTARELAAVSFARKLTATPAGITDADWAALKQEFGDVGALEVVLQTCAFSFMNRFTDNLRLPSEDEAIHIYQEVYGSASK